MATTEEIAIAEVYAAALLELANAQGTAESIDQEFAELAAFLKIDADLMAFTTSRMIDADSRRDSMDKMFQGQLSDLLLNTLQVMNRKGRTELITTVQQRYRRLLMEQQRIVEVEVTSAAPLSETSRESLAVVMGARTGQMVTLVEHVDPKVMGGLVVLVGDEQIDLSVAKQLRKFRDAVVEHGSRHIHAGTDLFEGATSF